MDWKHVLSLSPENMTEIEKDELFNTIAWYDSDSEQLSSSKLKGLFKLSQEIMKYKGEQVESLLAELDELATKQAEDELRKDTDTELKSTKSKKSLSSMDHDDYEDKIRNLKMKIKQQNKMQEKLAKELEKSKRHVETLERDKVYLQNELRTIHQEDSHSDISETIKDQHKDLVEAVHEKNRQISQLLDDIEVLETDNRALRDKLSLTRDQLSDATKQIVTVNNEISAFKLQIEEKSDVITKLNTDVLNLKEEIVELTTEKENRDKEIETFSSEIEARIDEWKRILDEKNKEIKQLKTSQFKVPSSSSSTEEQVEFDYAQVSALNLALKDQEKKILQLQEQLVTATNEMEESTKLIESLTIERNSNNLKINEQLSNLKELKNQLTENRNYVKDLEESIIRLKRKCETKDKEVNDLIDAMKHNGQDELASYAQKLHESKIQNGVQENQIANLVQSCNKLQTAIERFDLENAALREQLGLADDDHVYTKGIVAKRKKDRKTIQKLQKSVNDLEEEKLSLRLQIQNMTKQVSTSGEIIDSSKDEVDKGRDTISQKYKDLVDENEALRQGLHEVLDSLKKSPGDVKLESETYKQLLRALDAKHISGWYHPAMRLQAELHTLQGVNEEIRRELHSTREELKLYKKNSTGKSIAALNETGINAELTEFLNHGTEKYNEQFTEKLQYYKQEYAITVEQISTLYNQYLEEKNSFEEKQKLYEKEKLENQEKLEVANNQLKEITNYLNLPDDENMKIKKLNEMSQNLVILNRKCLYLENSEQKLLAEITKLKQDLDNAQIAVTRKIGTSKKEHLELLNKMKYLENKFGDCVDSETYINLQNSLDKLQLEHRSLQQKFNDLKDFHKVEIDHTIETKNHLQREIDELRVKLKDALYKINTAEVVSSDDTNNEALSKRLAEMEVNEITERQRANHINNLYELVKEQLRNSEERYIEFEKFSKDLIHKNLLLQDNVKTLEDKILYFVDVDKFKETQRNCEQLLEENKKLTVENNRLSTELESVQKTLSTKTLWSSAQEYEFLSLKHQIVDLQSASDDKAVIARLSSDVVHARLSEAELEKQIDKLKIDLKLLEQKYEDCSRVLDVEEKKNIHSSKQYEDKIRELQQIVQHHRLNYYGFIPYTSENKFIEKMYELSAIKHEEFLSLQSLQAKEKESNIFIEQLNEQLKLVKDMQNSIQDGDIKEKLAKWLHEKNALHLQDLKFKRQNEFKESQLQQAIARIGTQEEQIVRLEEELLKSFHIANILKSLDSHKETHITPKKIDKETSMAKPLETEVKVKNSRGTQTTQIFDKSSEQAANIAILMNMQSEVKKQEDLLNQKENTIQEYKSKITELEMNISMFRNQLGDKQSQITFYEKYILELQSKKESQAPVVNVESIISTDNKADEVIALKAKLNELQESLTQKESNIVKFETLLKKDRDEHSLAAARMQEEVKRLHNLLTSQNQAHSKIKEAKIEPYPNKAVFEQYFQQVHALEKHSCDIHISMQQLTHQLQSAKEDIEKWKSLAESRLDALTQMKNNVQKENEKNILKYKQECDKWKSEVSSLKELIQECRNETNSLSSVKDLLKEKEHKILELSTTVRQVKIELKKRQESMSDSSKVSELESENDQLKKELETIKKRIDHLMKKEKNSREEIRNLKGQLIRKPSLSARSDKSDSTIREQNLQKKIVTLEEEVKQLKNQLEKQLTINEAHRMKVADDFEKWNKMKFFQQSADKFKAKLKAKEEEFDKLQHTCNGYRILIERLEREKHGLESRIKTLKNSCSNVNSARFEILETENMKLQSEIDTLTSKLEMQHHHSGGLGAVMLQEKLEAQERKIAILELSAKGTGEIRAEMERLQNLISSLQKTNLRLEAENLELNLDLQKMGNDAPHLREQIQHLENYIEVLKAEKGSISSQEHHHNTDSKKASELERTVFVLKRLVEKLQAENKRLQGGGRSCSITGRTASEEKLRTDVKHVKEQYGDSMKKITKLEQELLLAEEKIKALENKPIPYSLTELSEELGTVRTQLAQKTQLLEKVKVLLQRAATKEKALLEEVAMLRLKCSSK